MAQPAAKLPRGYRYAAWLFALLSLGISALIASRTFGQAEVILTPAATRASGRFTVTVREPPAVGLAGDEAVVPGRLHVAVVTKTLGFPATGRMQRSSDTVGAVTIVNTTSRQQPLVATTRLLAPNGVLVRLKDRVVVPAHGSVQAEVYPDQPQAFPTLPPSRFTIPGLAPSLQAVIYASSSAALSAAAVVTAVTEADLQAANDAAVSAIRDEMLQQFDAGLADAERLYSKLIQHEVIKVEAGADPGDARAEFPVTVQLRVVALAFDESQLLRLVRQQLGRSLPFTHQLQAVVEESLSYQLVRYDDQRREATLEVTAEGKSTLHPNSPLLNPNVLTGLTKEQIVSHYRRYPEIASVEVRFFPESLRRAPRSAGRITFTVK